MPFDEEDDEQSAQSQKIGLKKVSTQKSIFDSLPKKPTQDELDQRVKKVQERQSRYKSKVADLAIQFNNAILDKTLPENKNMFQKELERDLLRSMIQMAQEINADVRERDGEGSLSWITLLMKACFTQRDKINNLEYAVQQLQKKTEPASLADLVSKEITKALDGKLKSE